MTQKKFSQDPKVQVVSIEEFLEESKYLSDIKTHLWKENQLPTYGTTYYKITSKFLILIVYTWTKINFGMDFSEKLDYIHVAFRDGTIEDELLRLKLDRLLAEKEAHKNSEKIDEEISNIETVKTILHKMVFNGAAIYK